MTTSTAEPEPIEPEPEPLPEGHPVREAWVKKIAEGSTPVRELVDGRFVGWINPDRERAS